MAAIVVFGQPSFMNSVYAASKIADRVSRDRF
jgi:hypothetical protein